MRNILYATGLIIVISLFASCHHKVSSNEEMVKLLAAVYDKLNTPANFFASESRVLYYDSIRKASTGDDLFISEFMLSQTYLELGKEEQAIAISEKLLKEIPSNNRKDREEIIRGLGIAYLRLGERMNCIHDHSSESCIFPIAGRGVHADKTGSEKAIEMYKMLLDINPGDLEARWLYNIAWMTTGGYPDKVPPAFLIKGLDADSGYGVRPFIDVSVKTGLNTKNMAGGSIIDDFNNDGYLDLITSGWGLKEGMHYCRSNGNGTFTEVSKISGLSELTGGLNIQQTDYNNDGWKDIFVLRGAWKKEWGNEPNSLLKNNGDGTFTDVTVEAGLLSFHPTQTATWADFNNDGWLDVFIGNESTAENDGNKCEFYLSNKNGTFTEMADKIGCGIVAFVKGVTSGDFNNDGMMDIFVSTLNGRKILLKNEGTKNGSLHFSDVSVASGVSNNVTRTFPTWFWDYNNDGWLDILVSGYEFVGSLAPFLASEAMKLPTGRSGHVFLFKNNKDGTFEEVSEKIGLDRMAFAMGSNFGDIDNDGYPDIYMGTGNPLYTSLVPNKMFKNIGGERFVDVTSSARVGNLQKGHGVSFADFDYDGDEDIYIDMGGAFIGDAYQNSLFINPGQNNNSWINLSLEGVTSNKSAIGARIKVTFKERNGVTRSVYRDVNSGGSFGSNPLRQHIGIGTATEIESIEIKWPNTDTMQVFKNIQPWQTIIIKEGVNSFEKLNLKTISFIDVRDGLIGCYPSVH